MKKTKIIATISNKMCDVELLQSLYDAGMNVVRMNTAHQEPEDALTVVENVRKVSDKIAIMVDTKGPEIRTTNAKKPINVKTGDILEVRGDHDGECTIDSICVSYDHFVNDLKKDDLILIDDGSVELKVLDKTGSALRCTVENDGVIMGHKSINIPSVHIANLPSLSEKDKRFVEFAADNDIDFIAHSFVRRKEDILEIQEILDRKKSKVKIIAKIENQEGVNNIDEILDHAYGAMVARGDLAIEIPAERIPIIQKKLVKKCIERRKPVIIATQMLQSMVDNPRPTRAEVSDVANACLDHTDAIMLSGETAYGKYPVEAVRMMTKIALEIESSGDTFIDTSYEQDNNVTSYLSKAAVKAALRINTKGLIADTISGKTILSMAAYRGENPIYAQCYSKRVMRELALSYGVHVNYMKPDLSAHEFLRRALTQLLEEKKFTEKCMVTILAGHYGADNGASYVEISTPENMLKRV
ncbi:MAG: pyruvate kinase [Deltaproteobacteria bacterium]|nr:pyruvate kinase [Deltaproteobacteria bacterium]